MVNVCVESDRIQIRTPKSDPDFMLNLDRCRSLPGRRFDGQLKLWHVPATPSAAVRLVEMWGSSLVMDEGVRELLGENRSIENAARHKSGDAVEPIPGEVLPAWDHQKRAFWFAKDLNAVLLNMGMGTGKTKCAIDILRESGAKKILVLAPLGVCAVWDKQIRLHTNTKIGLALLDKGSVKDKKAKATLALSIGKHAYDPIVGGSVSPVIIVINYESARREPFKKWSLEQEWDFVVLDESHKIKASGSQISTYCSSLRRRAKRRLCLTGTPCPNNPLDLYGQYRFLDPGIFGTSYALFQAHYAIMGGHRVTYKVAGKSVSKPVQIMGFQNQDEMARRMDSIAFSARSEDVLDLPPAIHVERFVHLDEKESAAYKQIHNQLIFFLQSGDAITATNILVKMIRLQQITSGFIQNVEDGLFERIGTSKENELLEILEGIGNEPVAVMCRFIQDLRSVEYCAKKLGRSYGEVSGARKDVSGEWEDGDGDVLGVQIAAGSLGISLVRARYCVLLGVDYSPGNYEQALARVRRPGQTKPVTYIHIIAENTIDVKIREALERKMGAVEYLREKLT